MIRSPSRPRECPRRDWRSISYQAILVANIDAGLDYDGRSFGKIDRSFEVGENMGQAAGPGRGKRSPSSRRAGACLAALGLGLGEARSAIARPARDRA